MVQGEAESLPFADDSFDAALAILTMHHWKSVAAGLAELRRVARDRVVLLTIDPEALRSLWITRDYWPETIELDPRADRHGEAGAEAEAQAARLAPPSRAWQGLRKRTSICGGEIRCRVQQAFFESRQQRLRSLLLISGAALLVTASASPAQPANGGTPAGGREIVGCKSHPGVVTAHGPRTARRLALTFDDGPSLTQTPAILGILNRMHVHATFFEEGKHVKGREVLMGEILSSGDEIGNHSFHHPKYPGHGELAATNQRIKEATGFRPCLFRPPYGLVDGRVAAAARRHGLEIVLWDVDSRDDKHPGAAAIRSDVLSRAAPGSIVLMHDGGHHPQTVRALPGIIRGLRARGFGFSTVTGLLGGRMSGP